VTTTHSGVALRFLSPYCDSPVDLAAAGDGQLMFTTLLGVVCRKIDQPAAALLDTTPVTSCSYSDCNSQSVHATDTAHDACRP